MSEIDEVLNGEIATLLAVFFNVRANKDGIFEVTSKWRDQLGYKGERRYAETAKALSDKYALDFDTRGATELVAEIQNPDGISLEVFRSRLYQALVTAFASVDRGFDFDTEVALALFLFRGSPDLSTRFYAVDLKDAEGVFVENVGKILLLSTDNLASRLNLNFRELQKQQLDGKNRNTQVRVNLRWFFENILSKNANLNPYKYEACLANKDLLGDAITYEAFAERLAFYRNMILGRTLSETDVRQLRQELKFVQAAADEEAGTFARRNSKIITYAREVFPDECVGCKDDYPAVDRTFVLARNERLYFEINHVVAYSSDAGKADVLENLVKLCATCHRALTPKRAKEDLQRQIIQRMLCSRAEVENFVSSLIREPGETTTDFVFRNLK